RVRSKLKLYAVFNGLNQGFSLNPHRLALGLLKFPKFSWILGDKLIFFLIEPEFSSQRSPFFFYHIFILP
ncbi:MULTISPECIES: hypothetical protein, partial [Spirulina sp. CCY15215]|uniref:hypothetical protein n=1 Tax=Spirulina sp. CCY15215 TaxID=2767591 RepID=UPI00194F12CC